MTKRHSEMHWRGALYNALRSAANGLPGFVAWAAAHRDRQLKAKTLYKRLDGTDPNERVPIEDAELMTEYMLQDASARTRARDWIKVLAARFDMAAVELEAPPPGGGWPCEVTAIVQKQMKLTEFGGELASLLGAAIEDRQISGREAEQIDLCIDREIAMLLRMKRNVWRAAETGSCVIRDPARSEVD